MERDSKRGYSILAVERRVRAAAIVGALFLLCSAVTSPISYLVKAPSGADSSSHCGVRKYCRLDKHIHIERMISKMQGSSLRC